LDKLGGRGEEKKKPGGTYQYRKGKETSKGGRPGLHTHLGKKVFSQSHWMSGKVKEKPSAKRKTSKGEVPKHSKIPRISKAKDNQLG